MKHKGFFFLSEAPKAIKLKYKHKQNKNEKKKIKTKRIPSTYDTAMEKLKEDRYVLKEAFKTPQN